MALDGLDRASGLWHRTDQAGGIEAHHRAPDERGANRACGAVDRVTFGHGVEPTRVTLRALWHGRVTVSSRKLTDVRECHPDEAVVSARHLAADLVAHGLQSA